MLRALYKADLPQLMLIEEAVHVAPWSEETFKICFQAGYLGWVVELDKQVIGFVVVSMRVEECHILNLCVARAYQRQGWGLRLLEQAMCYAAQQGVSVVYLEVRRSNSLAIALYQKAQFQLIGERSDYYPLPSGSEDALIFAKSLRT